MAHAPTLCRRTLLRAATLAPAGAFAGAAAAAEPPLLVDTHTHCFDGPDSRRFPYHPQAPYRPAGAAGPEQLLRFMDAAGVRAAVVVHPEPYQDDHRYLEHCLAVGAGRFRGTCLYFADRPGWRQALPALVAGSKGTIVAARVHAYAPGRLPPFGRPELRALWKLASDLGLVMQIHFEPHYAAGFEPLIRAFPRTPVLIDNLGRPMQATPEEYARVLRWSKLPHVHMKLSGLPNPQEYPFRDPAPVVKQLIDAFGPGRLVWGGSYGAGVTADSYRAALAAIKGHIAHLGQTDQALILGGTAARLFRITAAPA